MLFYNFRKCIIINDEYSDLGKKIYFIVMDIAGFTITILRKLVCIKAQGVISMSFYLYAHLNFVSRETSETTWKKKIKKIK